MKKIILLLALAVSHVEAKVTEAPQEQDSMGFCIESAEFTKSVAHQRDSDWPVEDSVKRMVESHPKHLHGIYTELIGFLYDTNIDPQQAYTDTLTGCLDAFTSDKDVQE